MRLSPDSKIAQFVLKKKSDGLCLKAAKVAGSGQAGSYHLFNDDQWCLLQSITLKLNIIYFISQTKMMLSVFFTM